MGERLSVSKEIKNIMRDTGTAHLMAISGLHIAFAALLAAGLIRGGQIFLPGRWIHWQMPLIGGICCAAFYAQLTGMQPPHCEPWWRLQRGNAQAKWATMEWLGCMDMLSGGNFADGPCCHSLAKFVALCRCGSGADFGISGFPVRTGSCHLYCG